MFGYCMSRSALTTSRHNSAACRIKLYNILNYKAIITNKPLRLFSNNTIKQTHSHSLAYFLPVLYMVYAV